MHNSNVKMAFGVSYKSKFESKTLVLLLNLLLIYRTSSCQEIIVSCLAVAQVEGPKELGICKLPNARRGPQKNGGKIGLGKLRRQEKLIATLRDK